MSQQLSPERRTSPHPQDVLFALDGKRVASRHRGTIGIAFEGEGTVRIDVADGLIRVNSQLPDQADLWLKCTRDAWEALLAGEGEVGALREAGAVRLAGDAAWLSFLASVCEPPKSSLSVRLAADI